eukprot:gene94-3701_t
MKVEKWRWDNGEAWRWRRLAVKNGKLKVDGEDGAVGDNGEAEGGEDGGEMWRRLKVEKDAPGWTMEKAAEGGEDGGGPMES